MFRTTTTSAARALPRSFATLPASIPRASLYQHVVKASLRTSARPSVKAAKVLSLTVARPFHTSLVRYESKGGAIAAQWDLKKRTEELYKKTIEPVPEYVSIDSSTRAVAGEVSSSHEDDVDMMAGIRSDFVSGGS